MAVHRECCNHCMWLGPVNQDGTLRKHRPAREGTVSGERKTQDFTKQHCPGSNQPCARFGCEVEETTTPDVTERVPGTLVDPWTWLRRPVARTGTSDKQLVTACGPVRDCAGDTPPATKNPVGCARHGVEDGRGDFAAELGEIPVCESGVTYGAWSESAGGFVYSGLDCAFEVLNWAADELRQLAADDDTDTFQILAVCREHEEQPMTGCEDCADLLCGAVDAEDPDACGTCGDCTA